MYMYFTIVETYLLNVSCFLHTSLLDNNNGDDDDDDDDENVYSAEM